jgi:hypothetical protein
MVLWLHKARRLEDPDVVLRSCGSASQLRTSVHKSGHDPLSPAKRAACGLKNAIGFAGLDLQEVATCQRSDASPSPSEPGCTAKSSEDRRYLLLARPAHVGHAIGLSSMSARRDGTISVPDAP